jgi:hypothetical protein
MAFVGLFIDSKPGTTIGTNWTYSFTRNFSSPKRISAYPVLQKVLVENDSWSGADCWVASFVNDGVTSNVSWIGAHLEKCTSITYKLYCNEASVRMLCLTWIRD